MSKNETTVYPNPVTGREVRQLTKSSMRSIHGYFDLCPWSPDGQWITFTRLEPGANEGAICIIPARGGEVRTLARTRSVRPNTGAMAQFSVDSSRVYFNDRDASGHLLAWVDIASGKTGSRPGALRMLNPKFNVQAHHPQPQSLADDDDAVPDSPAQYIQEAKLFTEHRDKLGVYVQNLDTGEDRRIASIDDCVALHPLRDKVARTPLFIKHTKWTADGKRLLFVVTNRKMVEDTLLVKDLYVIDADGTNLRRVGDFGNHPTWHPDGRRIFCNAAVPGRPHKHLVLIDVETGEREAIEQLANTPGGHPSFSPDGRYIVDDKVYWPGGKDASIFLLEVATGNLTELVKVNLTDHSHAGTHLHPVWSRDGKEVLYASDASGHSELCVVSV